MLWETSLLDADEGIRFRGYSIPELQEKLPRTKADGQPLPEGMLWLLLTGTLPTPAQVGSCCFYGYTVNTSTGGCGSHEEDVCEV